MGGMKILRGLGLTLIGLAGVAAFALWMLGRGVFGDSDSETKVPQSGARSAREVSEARRQVADAAAAIGAPKPARLILFGDRHVHTTISFDAFMLNLPAMGGEGAHTPADACDFARHCAALDFWSINDHASNILPRDWKNSIESIRRCNALSGDPANPDTVAFLGWEWTQSGLTPDTHYGHKNVVLAHTDDERIPARPVAANSGGAAAHPPPVLARGALALQGGRYHDMARRWTAISEIELCPEGDVRDLPEDCIEVAPTPDGLFRKLDEWGHDAIVIPHGTSWGIYTPPGSSWDNQLRGASHDPERQTLIEVYSGHGDAEVYRDWRPIAFAADGAAVCPAARADYVPMCRRAGEIVKQRCLEEDVADAECEARAEEARHNAVNAGSSPQATVPGATDKDWLDAGQCRDCGQPAFKYRPTGSAQYIAALGNFDEGGDPRRFRMGFIGSSDIHRAKPGTGYKELRFLSESPGRPDLPTTGIVASFLRGDPEPPVSRSRTYAEATAELTGIQLYESERTQSFLYTGGLVAVHADGRDRASIWKALDKREVYATSGPHILLWFDLLSERGTHPMGAEIETRDAPVFRVRAVGSFEQAPGCPDASVAALGRQEVERLCGGECYHPTDVRRPIARIDLVRIRPQVRPDEDVAGLIDDPWRSFECPPDPAGCVVTFTDDEYPAAGRDTVYYARVFEAPAPAVNGDPLRCTRADDGGCIESFPCQGGEDCLSSYAQRAWSSPIYVDHPR
jgi:hypothetical protein